ncbi:hypothetical protein B8B67_31280 [Pseudomonas aeruginosa]|nr:hypothetical protein B8B67_31280 [Pseudomonas aeruginosa]
MLFASTPADKAILPTAWGGRYFFNRIGRFLTVQIGEINTKGDAIHSYLPPSQPLTHSSPTYTH